jgi:hypothetical protein
MRRGLIALGLVAVALAVSALAVAASDDELLPNEQHFLDASGKTYDNGTKSGSALNMVAVGQNALADRGFNGDVFVYRKLGYIGRLGLLRFLTSAVLPVGRCRGRRRARPGQPGADREPRGAGRLA